MKDQLPVIVALLLLLTACANQTPPPGISEGQITYDHPIPFAPSTYVCYRATRPLAIDGRPDEADWAAAAWTQDFVDIQGQLASLPPLRTRAKLLWDDEFLYVAAELEEPHLWATLTQRDTVIFHDDDFEVFIDPDGDGLYYGEFEMNAFNTVWDLLILYPYRIKDRPNYLNSWDLRGLRSGVHLRGTLNDPSDRDIGWTVEVALPWAALAELASPRRPPREGDQWRLGFSRVDWPVKVVGDAYVKEKDGEGNLRREENWVWSPQGFIDMHRPETWGFVQFTTIPAGSGEAAFIENQDEKVRWALWQLFHQQRLFREKNDRYASGLAAFTLPDPKIEGYRFTPSLEVAGQQFEFRAATVDGSGQWRINQEGRIWKSAF